MIARPQPLLHAILCMAALLACSEPSIPTEAARPVVPTVPVTPGTPVSAGLQKVQVTIVTSGVHLDADGYDIVNDEWGYDVGDGATVPAPVNGTVTLYLRPGDHILSLVHVAPNCTGQLLGDRPVIVASGDVVTEVVFEVECSEP